VLSLSANSGCLKIAQAMSVANECLLPLTFELVLNLGQAIPNGTVVTYRFVEANSGVIESLKPRSGVTKNPLDK
jgi:hypothetical protein